MLRPIEFPQIKKPGKFSIFQEDIIKNYERKRNELFKTIKKEGNKKKLYKFEAPTLSKTCKVTWADGLNL